MAVAQARPPPGGPREGWGAAADTSLRRLHGSDSQEALAPAVCSQERQDPVDLLTTTALSTAWSRQPSP